MSLQRVALIGKSPSRSFGDVCATVSGMAPANNTIPTIEANNCVELIMRCSYLGTLHAAALRLRSRIPTNLPENGLKIIVPTMSAVSLRYAFMVCPVRLRRQSSLPQAGGGTVLAARAQMAVPRPAVIANSRQLTRQERSCGRYGRRARVRTLFGHPTGMPHPVCGHAVLLRRLARGKVIVGDCAEEPDHERVAAVEAQTRGLDLGRFRAGRPAWPPQFAHAREGQAGRRRSARRPELLSQPAARLPRRQFAQSAAISAGAAPDATQQAPEHELPAVVR